MEYNDIKQKIYYCLSLLSQSSPTRERSLARTKLEEALLWLSQDEFNDNIIKVENNR